MRNLWGLPLSVVFLAVCAVFPCASRAQPQDSQTQQNQSVADVARRNSAQKKNAARQSRVITNDDLDMEHFKPGQEGLIVSAPSTLQTPSASAAAAEAADQTTTSANKESGPKDKESEEAAAEDAEIARLKDKDFGIHMQFSNYRTN